MIWALLAILGVPLWIVVGGLLLTLYNRRRFKKQPDVFRMKLRLEEGESDFAGEKWPRMANYGHWVHDVLLYNKGLGLIPTVAIGVQAMEADAQEADPKEAKGLGDNPVTILLRLDDGSLVHLGVSAEDVDLAKGPFSLEEAAGETAEPAPA